MISKPKLYMSDWVEISPLYRYSGAMYPLHTININYIIGITSLLGGDKIITL
jgi:hypothetical protein